MSYSSLPLFLLDISFLTVPYIENFMVLLNYLQCFVLLWIFLLTIAHFPAIWQTFICSSKTSTSNLANMETLVTGCGCCQKSGNLVLKIFRSFWPYFSRYKYRPRRRPKESFCWPIRSCPKILEITFFSNSKEEIFFFWFCFNYSQRYILLVKNLFQWKFAVEPWVL